MVKMRVRLGGNERQPRLDGSICVSGCVPCIRDSQKRFLMRSLVIACKSQSSQTDGIEVWRACFACSLNGKLIGGLCQMAVVQIERDGAGDLGALSREVDNMA